MFAEERQRWILLRVEERGSCQVEELARHLALSTVTIRHDLRTLEERGLLHRTRGGAAALGGGAPRWTSDLLAERCWGVAEAAAELVRDGDTLALDFGAAALALALVLRLRGRRVTVVTCALDVAVALEAAASITTLVTGGTLCRGRHALLDPFAGEGLARLHVDLAFLGADGVDARAGATAATEGEATLRARLLGAGRRGVLLAGAEGLGRVAAVRFAELRELDLLVTDRGADPGRLASLRAAGVEILLA